MEYLLGYILGCFIVISGLGFGFSSLHRRTPWSRKIPLDKTPPLIKSHALISFSIVLPFSALSFLLLTFAALRIARVQGNQGHLDFIISALVLPTVCFLVGYFFFKKAVKS